MRDREEFSRPYTRYVIGIFMVANVFNFLDRQILSILLQPIKEDLGVSDTAMGFLSGIAFAIFYSTAGIPIARWADRGNRVLIMSLGIALWSAMTALSGLARNFAQLAVARIGVGVGEAALTPAAHSLISDYFAPAQRATALAIYTMGAQFGLLFGLWFGGLLGDSFGWRVAFMAVSLPGLLVALLVRLTLREPARGHSEQLAAEGPEPFPAVVRFLWSLPSFRHLALGASLQAFFGYGFLGWAPTFLIRVHDMTLTQIALPLGLTLGLGGAIGTFLGGRVTDRLGGRDSRRYLQVPGVAALMMTPFALAFLHWPHPLVAMLFYVPAVILGNIYPAPIYATTQNLARLRMRGTAASILLLVINLIGLGLGPQIVGIMNDLLAPRLGELAIRYSLSIVGIVTVWGGIHFLLAARTLPEDLRAKSAPPAG